MPVNYDGPDESVECAYPGCSNKLRRSDFNEPQFCSKEHRDAAAAPLAASDREPAPDWIPYATDERPSDAMPQAGFEDWREQAKWWQDNAVYWRGRAQDAQHGRELARLDTERERSEADRYRAALERIYQQGRGPHVAIAKEALDAAS